MSLPEGRLLGLDYGSRRIGMAVSDPLGITAQPLPPIVREGDEKDIASIAHLAREYEAAGVVVGLPLHLDGGEGSQARKAIRFAEKIRERLGLPVEMWDERMTTAQAERHLIESGVGRGRRKEIRDSLAAVFILQCVLDFRGRK